MKSKFWLVISVVFLTASCASTEGKDENEKEVLLNNSVDVNRDADREGIKASFVDIHNNVVHLDAFRGKVVVLNFWATWCPPCIREMPSLNRLFLDLKSNRDIVFLAIDVDGDIKGSSRFMAKNKFDLPLFTLDGSLPPELETKSIPMTVILDKKGEIAAKHTGMVDFDNVNIKAGLLKLVKE